MHRNSAPFGLLLALVIIVLKSPPPAAAQATPAAAVPAARPHDQMPSATAARRNGSISVDGRLDEAAWQAAAPITEFTQYDPEEGKPGSERTEARILIDDVAIYVGIRFFDSEPGKIQSVLARRDESVEGDLVELTFDSFHDHLTAYIFRLTPAGARRDATVSANGNQDNSWDAVWEGMGSIDSLGWVAEFRIPLSQLRYDPKQLNHTWGLQIGRMIGRKGEHQAFAFTPKNESQGIARYGHLTGLGRLASPRRLELVPYALTKNENPVVIEGDPFRKKNDIVVGAGLDLKYGITSNITLDATFNPDFGQVEVDPAVVNLSAFETFFPERRPFFVEGANIFSFGDMRTNNTSNGYNFIHTRRIGRQPARFISGDNIDFVDSPLETTIAGALKLTGRTSGGWSFGVLDALTLEEEARYRDGTTINTAIVEPMANYSMGRLKRDLNGGNTTVGMAVTTVNRKLGDEELKPIFRSSAYSAGFDWQHAWQNRTYAFDGAIVGTTNRGSKEAIESLQRSPARYFQRVDREDGPYDPNKTSLNGYVAEATFAKLAGEHWKGSVSYQEYSPGFEINEAGFLGSTDMRSVTPLIYYDENKPGKYLRGWEQFLFWNPSWNFDGDMTFNGVGAIHSAELRNFWSTFIRADWRPPVFDDRLTRGGPVARTVSGGGMQLEVSSDRRKQHTYGIYLNRSWNSAGGRGTQIAPRLTLKPSTAVRVTLSPTYSVTHAMAQYVTAVQDVNATDTYRSRYVFATLDQKQLVMVTRVDWTFTPALSLQLFAQPLLAAADFNDYKEFSRPREFNFEIYGKDAGTIAYDASTDDYTVDPDGAGPSAPFTFGDRDFNRRSLRGNAVLRWEYRPGSALFLVWQQSRFEQLGQGEFSLNDDFVDLLGARPENVFVLKGTWWIGR